MYPRRTVLYMDSQAARSLEERIEEIKRAMSHRNLSARKIASETGLSKRAVNDMLHGRRDTRASTVNLVYLYLGLKVDKEVGAA